VRASVGNWTERDIPEKERKETTQPEARIEEEESCGANLAMYLWTGRTLFAYWLGSGHTAKRHLSSSFGGPHHN